MVEKERACESKSAVKSKLNWTGFVLVILGAITDPVFRSLFGSLLQEEWLSRVMFAAGWLVIGLRTLGTAGPVTLDWRRPWSGSDG
jgi:hypothetical protein